MIRRGNLRRLASLVLALSCAAFPAWGQLNPEAATGRAAPEAAVRTAIDMAVTAHPEATRAAREVLGRGGSAVDAAIAAQLVLGLVEPQSSGIGGGGFLLHWDPELRQVTAYDGRETAPAAARPDRFLGPDGKPMPFMEAVVSGRSIGVPGLVPMLALAHADHGVLPWRELFDPAIRLARAGFTVTPRLAALLRRDRFLRLNPAAASLYYPGGEPLAEGASLRHPALAATLERLASDPRALNKGDLARAIVSASALAPRALGDMTMEDLDGYRAERRRPVCATYRRHTLCGPPPPSSGGVAVLQILGMLERFELSRLQPNGLPLVHRLTEAGRLAFADRDAYVADPDFTEVPLAGLLDPDYLSGRSRLIGASRSLGVAAPGAPPGLRGPPPPAQAPELGGGTTHLSIVDRAGRAVSMTTSIENAFGSRQMVSGFLLNNQLTDFAFRPERDGVPLANRVEGSKRPRSSMAPFLVFDPAGRLAAVVGSPGGPAIIGYVARAVIGLLDHGMDARTAAGLPNVVTINGPTAIEEGGALSSLAPWLRAMGHEVRAFPLTSGLGIIRVLPDGFEGGADPRREGVASGH